MRNISYRLTKSPHLVIKTILFLAAIQLSVPINVAIAAATNISGNTLEYISSNPDDLPPDIDRETAVRSTDPDRAPAYGPADAKVIVVIFADFQCPACRRSSQAVHQIASEFPGSVRFEFRNLPLRNHKNADLAAVSALAAQRQGRFWEMHDALYATRTQNPSTIDALAKEIGLDMEQFRADMKDPELTERVKADIKFANDLGITRTPGWLFNGEFAEGWASRRYFVNQVRQELRKADALSKQGMEPFEIQNQRALDNFTDSISYELYRLNVLEPLAETGE